MQEMCRILRCQRSDIQDTLPYVCFVKMARNELQKRELFVGGKDLLPAKKFSKLKKWTKALP